MKRSIGFRTIIMLIALAASIALPSAAADLSTRKSSTGGVTDTVTPRDLSAESRSWDFSVALDTHSQDLSDDLLKSVVLVDEAGTRHAPTAWTGAGPGGHHREGVLSFLPPSSKPRSIELQI